MNTLSTGYGSYATAIILGLAVVAHSLEWLDDAAYQTLLGLLGAGGLAFLRAAQAKSDALNAKTATDNAIANGILAKAADVKPAIVASIVDQTAISPVAVKSAPVKG